MVPRGCALFYVPLRNQHLIRSTVPTSHGFVPAPRYGFHLRSVIVWQQEAYASRPGNASKSPFPPSAKSQFVRNFEFVGTVDGAPYLSIPAALAFRESVGGDAAIREYCFNLAREGGELLARKLGTEVLENDEGTLGECCFTNVRLPMALEEIQEAAEKRGHDWRNGDQCLEDRVRDFISGLTVTNHNTFMAIMFHGGAWWVRISAQIYLEKSDFEFAGEVLVELCAACRNGDFVPTVS